MNKTLDYAEAIIELEQIVNEIENAAIGIDELSEKVKRAAWLIKFCRNKLSSTEKEVTDILKSIEQPEEEID
ncbi:MAG: exodeoxyribonuclease VII small subunit [Lentimicrobiaceae bacterium]|nr:exodeoxyribonuclease VII small subunit [Lentimicrobiaceae bacterium]